MMFCNSAGIVAATLHGFDKYLHPTQILHVARLDDVAKQRNEGDEGRKKDRPASTQLGVAANSLRGLHLGPASKYQLI